MFNEWLRLGIKLGLTIRKGKGRNSDEIKKDKYCLALLGC